MPNAVPTFKPGKKERREYRPSASERGYNYAWQKQSKDYLKAHPLCVHCLAKGITVAAECVDHITPKESGGSDFESNLQALCWPCHSRKTVLQDGGLGHVKASKGEAESEGGD